MSNKTVNQPEVTSDKTNISIQWYRTKLDRETFKALHQKNDRQGWIQAGGYLLIILATGGVSAYCAIHSLWIGLVISMALHGTICAFMINAVHELTHGTVFKTKALNSIFAHLFAWIGWINHEVFTESHLRHHRFTLHDPDDSEVVLPIRIVIKQFFTKGFIDPIAMWNAIADMARYSMGRFKGDWEKELFPEGSENQVKPIRWARILFIGHSIVLAAAFYLNLWWLPLLVTLTPLYGSALFFLLNNTQHIGLKTHVPDFRLCCRTIYIPPVLEFIYWNMNYHVEHHMYAAVPCYNLKKLHQKIRHDLPPICNGIVEAWVEIGYIQQVQKENPNYQHVYQLP